MLTLLRRIIALPLWLLQVAVVMAVTVALTLALIFVFPITRIPTGSMEPGVETGSITIGKSTMFGGPDRGDRVIFTAPSWDEALDREGVDWLKRVIAMPGDTVGGCDDQGRLMVNGEGLDEPYLAAGSGCDTAEPITVPDDHFYALGDNREHSRDSRYFTSLGGPETLPLLSDVGVVGVASWKPPFG